ncbi:thioredoxin-like protein [Myriangium duriaei CBS 260.36]|uniref:Protein disulfide-isomerase n=1 Tax=Myriangium duriaei CBS 260.36 TaxID=1168546 RepID=A0A9P4IVP9_9PEZI|nr:thioredoxin-like protein [Myriangium duriaei CBS 260.36]
MRSSWIYSISLLMSSTRANIVQQLTSDNFDSFIATHELSLISFIVPWCQYCQALTPVLETVAEQLIGENWPLAQVNCEEEKDLCRKYQIPVYPTLFLFQGNKSVIYNGPRESDAIISFVQRQSRPLVTALTSIEDLSHFKALDRITIIGCLDDEDTSAKAVLADVADLHRDIYSFASLPGSFCARSPDAEGSSMTLYKPFDEEESYYTGYFGEEQIGGFIIEAAHPLMGELGVDLAPTDLIFSRARPVALVFADNKHDREVLASRLRPVAESTRGSIVWATADPAKYGNIANKMALKPESWPAFGILDSAKDFKFAFPAQGSMGDLSEIAIRKTIDAFLEGQLQSTTRSESEPEVQSGSVTKVVADSYNRLVLNSDKDVLVFYYSPTCKHCKELEPVYDLLGDKMRSYTDQIIIAKIDATKNDISPPVTSYPTVKLFRHGAKTEPITFEGSRTLEALMENVKVEMKGKHEGSRREIETKIIVPRMV